MVYITQDMILNGFGLRNIPDEKIFPFTLELVENLPAIALTHPVTIFVGENGSGKSTLLEALAYAANVPSVGGLSLNDDPLMEPARRLGKMMSLRFAEKTSAGFFVRAEDFLGFVKNILRNIAELDAEMQEIRDSWTVGDLERALATLKAERKGYTDRYTENFDGMSHGEGFLRFFNQRITGKGLYLIDEPEAALSPARQLSLIKIIMDAVKDRGSQFIIATHSPIIMAMPQAQILHFDNGVITERSYTETDHYRLTKSFLEAPGRYMEALNRGDE